MHLLDFPFFLFFIREEIELHVSLFASLLEVWLYGSNILIKVAENKQLPIKISEKTERRFGVILALSPSKECNSQLYLILLEY